MKIQNKIWNNDLERRWDGNDRQNTGLVKDHNEHCLRMVKKLLGVFPGLRLPNIVCIAYVSE